MVYHYCSWSFGNFSAETFLGRLGIYGVSIFYVLSGLTLFYVYKDKMKANWSDVSSFFKKRVFRIFPLLWLVTIVAILLSGKMPDIFDLVLNLTGIFGFVKWDAYFSAGVWSIGNELVFYVFFVLFMILLNRSKAILLLFSAIIFGLFIYFAFFKLTPDKILGDQWKIYINPLNQVFLFLGGFLIGHFSQNVKLKNNLTLALLTTGLLIFTLFPAEGDQILLVTGVNRLVFTACCFLICYCFYKLTIQPPQFIHKPLTMLEKSSYSVYLLHPIIWTLTSGCVKLFSAHVFELPTFARIIIAIPVSLVTSYFVYQYFEKYFMRLGRERK